MITHELKVIERMSEGVGLSLELEGLLIQGVSIDSRTFIHPNYKGVRWA